MKKLLLLLLLSPFVYSELSEYYCEENVANYLTLKIDYDLNNPSFVIENHTDINSVGKNNFVKHLESEKVDFRLIGSVTSGEISYNDVSFGDIKDYKSLYENSLSYRMNS